MAQVQPPQNKPQVNKEKIAQLQRAAEAVRTGGKGSIRRKKKVSPAVTGNDDAKIQAQFAKKLSLQTVPECEEVTFWMNDNTVMQFAKPKLQASYQNSCYLVKGKSEQKKIEDVLPSFLNQFSNKPQDLETLKKLAEQLQKGEEKKGDAVPAVESFETPSN